MAAQVEDHGAAEAPVSKEKVAFSLLKNPRSLHGSELHLQGYSRELLPARVLGTEGDQRGVGLSHRVAQGARDGQSPAVASRLGEGKTSRGKHEAGALDRLAAARFQGKARLASFPAGHFLHAVAAKERHANVLALPQQGLNHVLRSVAHREHLARLFDLEGNF